MDESLTVDADGVSPSYRVDGSPDAPAMVLLHGLTSDASSRDAVLPERVEALVLEETPPPLPQQRPVPTRPPGELPYDWAARRALVGQVNTPDPQWWDRLTEITAPTLVVGGGPESPFGQEEMAAMAARIPNARMVSIPVGHRVHKTAPAEFAAAVQEFVSRTTHGRTTQTQDV